MLRIAALFLALATLAVADEGMWPYNQFPADTVKQKRDFDLPPLASTNDNLRLASVKLSSGSAAGGSAAFVSPNGLLLTNQHLITAYTLHRYPQVRPLRRHTESAETKCESLQASVLLSIDDVTTQVKSATKV